MGRLIYSVRVRQVIMIPKPKFHPTLFVFVLMSVVFTGCGSSSDKMDVSRINDRFEDGSGSALTNIEILSDLPVPEMPRGGMRVDDFDDGMIIDEDLPYLQEDPQLPAKPNEDFSFEEKVQNGLKNAGYYDGKTDGVMDKTTRDAVVHFQKSHALTPDGVVGPKTWDKLKKYYYNPDDV